jgi:hypothetical protein
MPVLRRDGLRRRAHGCHAITTVQDAVGGAQKRQVGTVGREGSGGQMVEGCSVRFHN